jgi:hypothetical protein
MNCSEDMLMARQRKAKTKTAKTVHRVAERNQVAICIAVPIFVVVKDAGKYEL